MAEFLPGRTDNAIKNRFYSNLRKYTKSDSEGFPVYSSTPISDESSTVDDKMFSLLQ
jgi:hypothetical protein